MSSTKLRKFTTIDIAAVLFIFALVLRIPADPDMWWHLKVGQDILAGIFPYHDIYTWSMPGYAWVDHEWLTEVLMYIIQHATGLIGLGLAFTVVTLAAYGIAVRTGVLIYRHINTAVSTEGSSILRLGLVLVIVTIIVNLGVIGLRPQVISLLGFTLVSYLIWQYLTGERRSLWLLVPLFMLWANMHGAFSMGLLLIGLTLLALIGAMWIQSLRNVFPFSLINAHDMAGRVRHTAAVLAGSVLAGLLNPYTYRIYEEVLRTGTDREAHTVINEWLSVNFQNLQGLLIGALVFLFLWWLIWSRRSLSAWHMLILPVFLYLGFSSIRFSAPLVIFLLPWMLISLADVALIRKWFGQILESLFGFGRMPWFQLAVSALIPIISVIVLIVNGSQFITYSTNMKQLSDLEQYPAAAVDYLRMHTSADDRIFNDYNWGGYLIWFLPEHKVYIDGRMASWQTSNVHILDRYLHVTDLAPDWMDELRATGATVVLTDARGHFAAALSQVNSFQQVYRDDVAVIYRRK